MMDNYSHGDFDIVYICENILGPAEPTLESEELVRNFNSQLVHNCRCSDKCMRNTCACLDISGGANYNLVLQTQRNSTMYILNKKSEVNTFPIIECNELCECSDHCGNRLVQHGPIEKLFVKLSPNKLKGLGLFTFCVIPAGSFICEYAGEVLTRSQASLRHYHNEAQGKANYIFCLNEHVGGKIVQTYIDPTHFGNIGRYINHSCDPNCEILPVRVNSPIVKLAVFSILDIAPDTEITFDYGSSDVNNPVTDTANRKICLCNTERCKGFLPYHSY